MTADFQKLRRKPFFLPLLMPLVLFAAAVASGVWLLDARSSTTVVLVRHAEAERSLSANPGLSDIGRSRANQLVTLLENAKPERGVDAIYASDSALTQQTAAPVAARMGLAVNVVTDSNWKFLLPEMRDQHAGQVVLVVASREQLLDMLQNLTDQAWTVEEADFGSVFVVSQSRLSKPAVIRLRY
jgi:phosphohistidine phosphatase SixA